MTEVPAWDSDLLRSKAALYFERAFTAEAEEDPELFAFWSHLGLELLLRAAVAHISPALLSGGKRPSLLYGLGLDPDADPLSVASITMAEVIDLAGTQINDFGVAESATCKRALLRRNAELHSATAAMADLERGWRGRLFAACKVLADHLGTTFTELFGTESGELAEKLIDEEAEKVRDETRSAIEAARRRAARLSSEERAKREKEAEIEFMPEERLPIPRSSSPDAPRILRQVACPACETPVVVRGDVVRPGSPRIDAGGELVRTDVALPTLLNCPVCELRLEGVAQLTQAGLGDPIPMRDVLDPVEALDVDLDAYQDQFLEALTYEREYEDE